MVSLSSSAEEICRGAGSVELPDSPLPADLRVPDGYEKPLPLRCVVCGSDPGVSLAWAGGMEPLPSPERCQFCFLSSEGGSWFALPGTPGDHARKGGVSRHDVGTRRGTARRADGEAGVVGRSSRAPWGKGTFSCRQGRGDHKSQLSSDDKEGRTECRRWVALRARRLPSQHADAQKYSTSGTSGW